MNLILYAVPFFFVLIVAELLADRWRGVNNYRVADAVNSISTGVLSTTTGLLTKGHLYLRPPALGAVRAAGAQPLGVDRGLCPVRLLLLLAASLRS